MEKLRYLVTENGFVKAGFVDKLDAWNYKDMITSVNRMAGYRDKYEIKDSEGGGDDDEEKFQYHGRSRQKA